MERYFGFDPSTQNIVCVCAMYVCVVCVCVCVYRQTMNGYRIMANCMQTSISFLRYNASNN